MVAHKCSKRSKMSVRERLTASVKDADDNIIGLIQEPK